MNPAFAIMFVLVIASFTAGCGGGGNSVSTQDDMKAHVEKYGDTALDPAASTPLEK